ncbi:hypothetical protein ACH3XW_0125 [Acanthocheilonema viteae]
MGNLSPEEILKRIEGDSKGKVKGNQKNGTNGSKDHSSVVANGSKSSGIRKRTDKKDRQTDKAARRSVIIDKEVVELSTKMEALNIEKAKAVVVTETTAESKHGSSIMDSRTSEVEIVTSSHKSDKVEDAGSGVTTTVKGMVDEGLDDEEQYISADEGANFNFSDDIYHTDEQSGASGSRDFISDGANYRADDEEINPLPVTAEESEFIQVTARSKRRGASIHHQLTMVPGVDRKNVYFNSTMDRGARTNVRRDADRLRRSSIQLPPDNRRNQPSSRGNTSPSPVDCESFQKYSAPLRFRMLISEVIDNTLMKAQENKSSDGKGQTIGTSGSVESQQQRQQQQYLKFATSTSTSKKIKYGLPSSLQTSRTASPDRRSSQPLTLKYSVAAAKLQSGSSPAVASLPGNLPDTKHEISEQQIDTVTVANTKAPAQRSWADIAKQRLYDNAETRLNITPHAWVDPRASVKEEHSVSGASISDHLESAKKPEHGEQKRTVCVGTVSSDSAVKDYTFFFDPNEPTVTVSKELEPKTSNIVPKETEEHSKSLKPRCSGIVLNLDGGRQVILPESDTITASPSTVVDIKQRPEVITANDMWRYFTEDATVTVTYREYKRQKERSQQQNETSKEEKKGEMTTENKGRGGESK